MCVYLVLVKLSWNAYYVSIRFEALLALGKKLVPSSPMSAEVKERMKLLSQERAAVKEAWENRNKLLKQCTDIQVCSDHCIMY